MQHVHDHQIRAAEYPFFGPRGGGAGERAEVFVSGEAAEVLAADAGEAGDFFLGEDFLARLDSDHGRPSDPFDAGNRLNVAKTQSNSRSVPAE
jgi:hypothetical protein